MTGLADALRAQGAEVAERAGWQSAGAELTDVRCWFLHHTASGPSSDGAADLNYIYSSGDLAPEYNVYIQRSGLITVGAAGKTNHGGKGGDYPAGHPDYAARGRKPIPWLPAGSANSHTVSCALANNGVGEPYPSAQQAAVLMFARAVDATYGTDPAHGLSHFEWTLRKIDPAGSSRWAHGAEMWNMDAFRADVASAPEPVEDAVTEYLIEATTGTFKITGCQVRAIGGAELNHLNALGLELVRCSDPVESQMLYNAWAGLSLQQITIMNP